MRGINSGTVDLIYLDPPFNSNANYAAPIGSAAAGAEFKDTWGLSDIDQHWCQNIKNDHPGLHTLLLAAKLTHGDSMMSYLIYMAPRLTEMRRLLKNTGSIYLHCDPTASHYLKLMMDTICGAENFLNEIIWFYEDSPGGRNSKWFPKKHDTIFLYAKSKGDHCFNDADIRVPIKDASINRYKSPRTIGGKTYLGGASAQTGKIPEDVWKIPVVKKHKGSKESTRYPTQKPVALLKRVIGASTPADGIVLDPFCGCATTCIAAEGLSREWVGIDISPKAADLVKLRMAKEMPLLTFKGIYRKDIPPRTDLGKLPQYNSQENKNKLYGIQSGNCNGCSNHFLKQHLTVDHIIPKTQGGTDHISNLQLLCAHCNSVKGQRPHEYLTSRLEQLGFINAAAKKILEQQDDQQQN